MDKVGGGRNFGWGKQIEWAGKQALRAAFGDGHYGTVASHSARWRTFCGWLREQGIRDARQVSRTELARFAGHLAQQTGAGMSVAYAKNQLTSINVALESLRGDRSVRVRPGDYVGKRTIVRSCAPPGLGRKQVERIADRLVADGKGRVAAVALLCRELGLRRREASLMDVRLANHQAVHLGRVNVVAGTKGGRGRSVDRWVPVSDTARAALHIAVGVAGNSPNLVPDNQSLAPWLTKVSREWSAATQSHSLGTLRDLRAAYACDRYDQITGAPAPAVAGTRIATKEADRLARTVLAGELGHNRTDVTAAYVGSAR